MVQIQLQRIGKVPEENGNKSDSALELMFTLVLSAVEPAWATRGDDVIEYARADDPGY
jgi:hypothetical protein